jgi:RNA polymerase sigma-70 factor (ECF subfamily)
MNAAAAEPLSDEELVRRAIFERENGREQRAGSELLARYQRPIFLWCLRYVRDRERAQDLTQEVMTKIWESLPRFQFNCKFSWWVFVVARNRCLNALEEPRSRHRHEELTDSLVHAEPGSDERLERLENIAMVRTLMQRHLDVQEREALALSHFERLSVQEITRLLGLSNQSGARALLQRARRKLRTAIETHGGELRP